MSEAASIKTGLEQSHANSGAPLETNSAPSPPSSGSQEDVNVIARVETPHTDLLSTASTNAFTSDIGDAHNDARSSVTQPLVLPPATSTPPELTPGVPSTTGPFSASLLSVTPDASLASFSVTNDDPARDLEPPHPPSQPPSSHHYTYLTPPQVLVSPPSYAEGLHAAFSPPSSAHDTKSFASPLLSHHYSLIPPLKSSKSSDPFTVDLTTASANQACPPALDVSSPPPSSYTLNTFADQSSLAEFESSSRATAEPTGTSSLFDLPLLPWESMDSNQLFIRAPRADEAWSQLFNSMIGDFESILGAATCDYAITLTVAVVSNADQEWTSPIVSIIVLSQDDPCFDFDRLSETVKRGQFGLVVCSGEKNFGEERTARSSNYRYEYHQRLSSGLAIGKTDINSTFGTVGIFMRNFKATFGITCGHVCENSPTIIQPTINLFLAQLQNLKSRHEKLVARLQQPLADMDRDSLEKRKAQYESRINSMNEFVASEKVLEITLEAGRVIQSKTEIVDYQGRRCYLDASIFELNERRGPVVYRELNATPSTEERTLAAMNWLPCDRQGHVQFDLPVRKLGVATGLTFGVISGVHTLIIEQGKPRVTEYFVLSDSLVRDQNFANKGDSGSAIVSAEGAWVGVCFGNVESCKVKLIMLEEREDWPDFQEMAMRTNEDGSFDFEHLIKSAYSGLRLTLISDVKMWEDLLGISKYGNIVQDL